MLIRYLYNYYQEILTYIQDYFLKVLNLETFHYNSVNYVPYVYNRKRYYLCIKPYQNVNKIMNVYGTTLNNLSTNEDVTEWILELSGPSHDFLGLSITPKLIGFKSLNITYFNMELCETVNKKFEDDEIIVL